MLTATVLSWAALPAQPATCGAAIEVPLAGRAAVSSVMPAETMSTPGAKMSTQPPMVENAARASSGPVAATVIACGARAGE